MQTITILIISIIFQLIAVFIAFRLIKITQRYFAWILIAVAFLFMAFRRIVTLISIVFEVKPDLGTKLPEYIALLISILMTIGLILIIPLFKAIKENEQKIKISESEIKSIFRSAPVGIGLIFNRKLLQVNEIFCEMLGYSENELLGEDSQIVYPSIKEYEYVGKEKYRQISEKGTGTVETKFKKKDGEIIDVILSSTPIDLNDLSKGVTFSALDITIRKRAERDLKESEERFRKIFQINYAIMLIIDPEDGKILDANPAAEEFYSYSHQQFTDDLYIHHINILSGKEIKEEMELVQKGEKGYLNFKHKLANGQIRDVEIYSGKIEYFNKVALFSIIHDITDRKKAETELAKYQNNLEQLVKERTSEIEEKNKELSEKNKELEKYNELFVGREFRIKELKDEIEFLKNKKLTTCLP